MPVERQGGVGAAGDRVLEDAAGRFGEAVGGRCLGGGCGGEVQGDSAVVAGVGEQDTEAAGETDGAEGAAIAVQGTIAEHAGDHSGTLRFPIFNGSRSGDREPLRFPKPSRASCPSQSAR